MTKHSVVKSRPAKKSKTDRLGLGSFEPTRADSYSRQKVRADFFHVIDTLEPDVANTLYKEAFFQFILLAWGHFPEAIPPPVLLWIEDESFLLELERVTKDFSASPYNTKTKSFHPAFVELLAIPFSKDQEMVVNHLREVLMLELLRPFEELEYSLPRIFPNWEALQYTENTAPLCENLIKWSRDWNCDEDWCRDYALAALCHWLSDRYSRWDENGLSLRPGISAMIMHNIWFAYTDMPFSTGESFMKLQSAIDKIAEEPYFHFSWRNIVFQTPRWNPVASYRDEWARKAEQEFIDYLAQANKSGEIVPTGTLQRFRAARDKYLRNIERAAPQVGLIKTPRRWANEHLIWAAHFQVQEWPLSKIKETYSKAQKTVADGINRTLDFIGLTRRPNLRSGMHKGTRLSTKRRIVRK